VIRLLEEGENLKDIRAYIDAEYSQYGPSTATEPVSDAGDTCSDTVETCGEPGEGEQVSDPGAFAPVTVSENQPN
jgi:hypothetical protein